MTLLKIKKIKLYLFFILSFSLQSFAQTKVTNVNNASAFTVSKNVFTVYGGISGQERTGECARPEKDSTCNNCEDSLKACNEKRIYPSLKLKIFFTYSEKISGSPTITEFDKITSLPIVEDETKASNGTGVIVLNWSSICNNAGSSGLCTSSSSKTYYIGIKDSGGTFVEDPAQIKIVILSPSDQDHNTVNACESSPSPINGVCQFQIYPGDEKIFFLNSDSGGLDVIGGFNYPNLGSGERAIAIRAFFVKSLPSETAPGFQELKKVASLLKAGSYSDLSIDSDGNIQNAQIRGLENNQTYFVRLSLLDPAGNISYFTSDAQLSARECDVNQGASVNLASNCKAIATTDEVFGLLTEDLNCFIATAAYGTSFNKQLTTFRTFRSQILLKSDWGKKLTFWYYKYGPIASRYIHNKPMLKSITRTLLWPIWLMAKLTLHLTKANAEENHSTEFKNPINWLDKKQLTPTLLTQNESVTENQRFDPKKIRKWDGKFRRRIKHPNSKKGLRKITKDLEYLYAVEESPQKNAASFRLGQIQFQKLQNEDTGNYFEDFYTPKNLMILIDYEWQKKNQSLGRFALKVGSGFLFSKGTGEFESSENQDLNPLEEFLFFMAPNNISAIYKLQLFDHQLFVPYIETGLDAFTFIELRSDTFVPKLGASLGYHAAVGLNINLGSKNSWASINLDREYGINELYLNIEYRQYFNLNSPFNFSGEIISVGFAFDI